MRQVLMCGGMVYEPLSAAGAGTAHLVGCETTKSASCEGSPRAAPPQMSIVQPSPVTALPDMSKLELHILQG